MQKENIDCKVQEEKINLESIYFDNLKTTLKVKFDGNLKLKNKNKIVVLLTYKSSSVKVLVKEVISSR